MLLMCIKSVEEQAAWVRAGNSNRSL